MLCPRTAQRFAFVIINGFPTFYHANNPNTFSPQVRARLPYPSFRDWPATWLLDVRNRRDQGLCWPVASEIDVYEAAAGYGNNSICGSYHWSGDGRCYVDDGRFRTGCATYSQIPYDTAFHTYTLAWSVGPGGTWEISWSYDDRAIFLINEMSDPRAPPPSASYYVIAETALAW